MNSIFLKTLEVAAPLISAIGGALLTYDALKAPTQMFNRFLMRGQLNCEDVLHKSQLRTIKTYGLSEAELSNATAAEDARHCRAIEEIENKNDLKEFDYKIQVRSLAIWGFLLVTIGCMLQAVVGILH